MALLFLKDAGLFFLASPSAADSRHRLINKDRADGRSLGSRAHRQPLSSRDEFNGQQPWEKLCRFLLTLGQVRGSTRRSGPQIGSVKGTLDLQREMARWSPRENSRRRLSQRRECLCP